MIEQKLRELGFTDNEIKVYIALLRIGHSKAGRIAKESSLERTSVYNALKKLLEKGLVSYTIESNRKIFSPVEPAKLLDYFQEKQERTKLIIPELEKLRKFEKEKENIIKFRGYAGIKTVLNDVLKSCNENDEYLIMGSEQQLTKRMPTFTKIFIARKDQKKLHARILVKEFLKKNKKNQYRSKYTKTRYVPQDVISPAVTNIYKNKVAIVLWSETPEAIIIENEDTAKTYRSYFEFMWKHAKK